MGQMVYVLTSKLEGKQGYGPVAVVTDQHAADEWIRASKENDWVPLELDDLSTTGMAEKQVTQFKPVPQSQRRQTQKTQLEDATKNMGEAMRLLKKKVKTHARRKGRIARSVQTYESWVESILWNYMQQKAQTDNQDPFIDEFMEWLAKQYQGKMPKVDYEKLVGAARAAYLQTFGPK